MGADDGGDGGASRNVEGGLRSESEKDGKGRRIPAPEQVLEEVGQGAAPAPERRGAQTVPATDDDGAASGGGTADDDDHDEARRDPRSADATVTLNPRAELASAISMDVPGEGSTIGRYTVRRFLGRGGSGVVVLARDTRLGRSVALKLFPAGRHASRFLAEARIVALLDHPNIIKLWDFGESDGYLYLALEYVEGETLQERLQLRSLAGDEGFRILRAIAEALAHAHACGVVHCDLKPANVMLGGDGRVRVVDFGIAQTQEGGARGGTPEWMAPEQVADATRAALTPAVDSWALGLSAFQLCTGAHPLGATPEQRREVLSDPRREIRVPWPASLAPAVGDLVTRALQRAPQLRPSMVEWKRVLDEALDGRGQRLVEGGPYPGLAAFDVDRAAYFFGRGDEVNAFVEQLRKITCRAIIGPSGVGKSSFLYAGVVPRLLAREPWQVVSFRPGPDPVGALARALVVAAQPRPGGGGRLDAQQRAEVQRLREDLLDTPSLLAGRLDTLARQYHASVLLAVDQMEEVFTHGAPAPERKQFLAMLLGAVDHHSDPMRVVFTVRDDFLGQLPLTEVFVLRPLGVEQLRSIVTKPLEHLQHTFDDGLVDELIRDAGVASVADLPLLQFACRKLWDGRDEVHRKILRRTYEEMGGVAGALARHAEDAMKAFDAAKIRKARKLLLHLVSGTTRRSVPRDRLELLLGADVGSLVEDLLQARLLVQRKQDDGESPMIEIAHESLLQSWTQLRRWVEESREERSYLDKLEQDAEIWERRGRHAQDTYNHNQLVSARQRARDLGVEIPAHLETFVAAGEARVRAARRQRRWRIFAAILVILITSIPLLRAAGQYLARERLIRGNAGTVELELAAYDWVDGAAREVPVGELPGLTLQLYAAREGAIDEPGEPLPLELLEVRSRIEGPRRVDRVTAPGGTVFLRITGRGRGGEACDPSWIRLQSFPGYGGTREVPRWTLEVPTCQASRADMIFIDAGPFVYGGAGEPPSPRATEADYRWPERVLELPSFAMDRTEVSNARFARFARIERYTGYPAPLYSNDEVHKHDSDPAWPVTDINSFTAQAYCRYLGKELPTDPQWVKAVRGGLLINGRPNPLPRRLYPTGKELPRACVNYFDARGQTALDGYHWTAPVESFLCGAGPYGHINLAGNVQEWIARWDQPDPENPHHVVRGGSADSPADLQHGSSIFVNHREPRDFDYSIGLRCVSNPVAR